MCSIESLLMWYSNRPFFHREGVVSKMGKAGLMGKGGSAKQRQMMEQMRKNPNAMMKQLQSNPQAMKMVRLKAV